MIQEDFQKMTDKDLREYILANRNDEDAVREAVTRIQHKGRTGTTEEFLEMVRQKLNIQ